MPTIDLATVTIHNSHDVRAWPATATITRLEFCPDGVHIEHTKNVGAGCWPNFRPPGWDGDLQYTLWIFLEIGGAWHGSGCIEYWQACQKNGGPPDEFAKNWYYDPNRWGPMTGHQPAPGELVGFMVTAGDARNSGVQSVQERSDLVMMGFPQRGDVYVPPAVGPVPPVPDVPVPELPTVVTPSVVRVLEQLTEAVDELADQVQGLRTTMATKADIDNARRALTEGVKLLVSQRIVR